MEFHTKAGKNVALSNGNRFAERLNPDQNFFDATLFSNRPVTDDALFEVELRQKVPSPSYVGGMLIGLISQDPNSIAALPSQLLCSYYSSWICFSGKVYKDNVRTNVTTPNLHDLNVGDRVGVLRSSAGALHLFINGKDLGAKAEGVPQGCYAAIDLYDIRAGSLPIAFSPWRIDNFKQLMQTSTPGFFVPSNHFWHKTLPGIEWFMKVYPNGYKEANGHVAIELCKAISEKKSSATAPIGQFSASFRSSGSAETTQWSSRVSKAVKFIGGAVCVVEKFASQDSVGQLCNGENDSVYGFQGEALEFPVHRAVIGAASSTLMRMLNTDFNETKGNELTIKESTLDAVKAMLQYIYGDPLGFDGLEELSLHVLKLADQYDLSGLKELCEKSLIAMVSQENVLDMANVAYLRSSSGLMKAVSRFIFDNKGLMSGDDWKKLKDDNCKLAVEILEFIIKSYEALPIN